jgi:DNA-binding phage protein
MTKIIPISPLEEGDEPKYLSFILKDVIEARVQMNDVSEEVKLRHEKLDKMLSKTKGAEIYALVELLDAPGYQIAIAPKLMNLMRVGWERSLSSKLSHDAFIIE